MENLSVHVIRLRRHGASMFCILSMITASKLDFLNQTPSIQIVTNANQLQSIIVTSSISTNALSIQQKTTDLFLKSQALLIRKDNNNYEVRSSQVFKNDTENSTFWVLFLLNILAVSGVITRRGY